MCLIFCYICPISSTSSQKYGTDSRRVAIKIFARYVAAVARDILRVKQGKAGSAKAEWTGGSYTGGHLLADSRHRQWKWSLPQIQIQIQIQIQMQIQTNANALRGAFVSR